MEIHPRAKRKKHPRATIEIHLKAKKEKHLKAKKEKHLRNQLATRMSLTTKNKLQKRSEFIEPKKKISFGDPYRFTHAAAASEVSNVITTK